MSVSMPSRHKHQHRPHMKGFLHEPFCLWLFSGYFQARISYIYIYIFIYLYNIYYLTIEIFCILAYIYTYSHMYMQLVEFHQQFHAGRDKGVSHPTRHNITTLRRPRRVFCGLWVLQTCQHGRVVTNILLWKDAISWIDPQPSNSHHQDDIS